MKIEFLTLKTVILRSDWITYFGAFYFSLFPVKWWFFLQNEFLTLENVILRSDWSKLTRDLEK